MSGFSQTDEVKGRGQRTLGAKGEATRQRIMEAAEEVFGTRGFHESSITDITQKAGVAQGTFYLYFESKLELFREVVREISKQLRRATTAAIAGISDRREAEREGLKAFFAFLQAHRRIYKVVREAEFVDEELFRWYYQRMAEGYTRRLHTAQSLGQINAELEAEALAWSIMGIAHMLGIRYVLWEEDQERIEAVLAEVMRFMNRGFEPGR